VSADLIDDEHGLALTGLQVIVARNAFKWMIDVYPILNDGRQVSIEFYPKLRRAAANAERAMSHVRHDSATLPLDEPESSAANRKGLTVPEVASKIGVDTRTIYRWLERGHELALAITQTDRLRFDEELVDAYVAAHPRPRSSGWHGDSTTREAR
jgi:excisionase family DNA binding protein